MMWNIIKKTRLLLYALAVVLCFDWSAGQARGSYNFAKKTAGEREGDLTPSAIAGVSIAVVAGVAGMIVTVFFCYFVYKQQKQQESFSNSFDVRKY